MPPEIRKAREGGSNTRLAAGSCPRGGGRRGREGCTERWLRIRAGRSPAESAATDAAEAVPAALGRAAPSREGPSCSLPPPPRLLRTSWLSAGEQKSGPHGWHCNLGVSRPTKGPSRGPGRTWPTTGWSRRVQALREWNGRWNPTECGPPPLACRDVGRGARVRSVVGEVSLHGPEEGRVFLTPGGMLPLFLLGGHFSSKLIHFPGKSAGLFFVRIQLCAGSQTLPL